MVTPGSAIASGGWVRKAGHRAMSHFYKKPPAPKYVMEANCFCDYCGHSERVRFPEGHVAPDCSFCKVGRMVPQILFPRWRKILVEE